MHSYEIAIYGMTDDDMIIITDALSAANIDDAGDVEVGAYQKDNKPRSVFVTAMEVDAAVAIINSLGFETDEDAV